jgi:3-oxoacyl-[acyl-carrier protein] reductase
MLLKDQVAIVTGSSRGIGAAAAQLLASQGARVAVNCCRNEAAGKGVIAAIEAAGGQGILVQADVTQADQVSALVERVRQELGPVDILVNNASIGFPLAPFTEYRWEDFERKLTGELKASFCCCQAVVPQMIERQRGCIVNVSSGLSRRPGPGFVAHTSAKSALDGFSKALALELGPHGIRVNVVAPGLVLTDATAWLPEQARQAHAAQLPLGRLGEPDDIAGAILLCCVDWARYITGTYLSASGGGLMI